MVFALRALQDLDLKLSVTRVVFVNSDEEVGSKEPMLTSHSSTRTISRMVCSRSFESRMSCNTRLETTTSKVPTSENSGLGLLLYC